MKGIQQRRTNYGSLDNTIITIENDESTPLLVDRNKNCDNNNNPKTIENTRNGKKSTITWSFGSSDQSSSSDYRKLSTKTFKSHFTEMRVLAFALLLATALIIAIYLLAIESRSPSITLSLDLVSHDIWSHKLIPQKYHLQHNHVDHIILMQTGNRNCDTSGECLKVLHDMQTLNLDQAEELPYNFLIGGDGQAYEVRGWEYPSNMKGVPQERSLVIGLIGNFNFNAPKEYILKTVKSLIRQSSKRRKINQKYYIYGLRLRNDDQKEGQLLFNEVIKWSRFKGFLSEL